MIVWIGFVQQFQIVHSQQTIFIEDCVLSVTKIKVTQHTVMGDFVFLLSNSS